MLQACKRTIKVMLVASQPGTCMVAAAASNRHMQAIDYGFTPTAGACWCACEGPPSSLWVPSLLLLVP